MKRDFYSIRNGLRSKSERFTNSTLVEIPYEQLYLCGIAPSETTACSLKLIREEKQRRRDEYLPYLFESRSFNTPLFQETLLDLRNHAAPKWGDLCALQHLWLKLTCLHNHTENFSNRINEAIQILGRCKIEGLDEDTTLRIMKRLKLIQFIYPIRLSEVEVREKLYHILNEVLKNMSTKEFKQIEDEIVVDFSCMSDCFRVLL
jgi:hypothetical protein